MINLTVIGSRYWEDLPILVRYIGDGKYKDKCGNIYEESYKEVGIWVFEFMGTTLMSRYVRILKNNELLKEVTV